MNEIKGSIRKSEAYQACKFLGLKKNNIHYLEMPFYQMGAKKRSDISSADISIVENLIKKIKTHQIFAAGDLSDPHHSQTMLKSNLQSNK